MKRSELKKMIQEVFTEAKNIKGIYYDGQKSEGKYSTTITIPVNFEILRNLYKYNDTKEDADDVLKFEVVYDRRKLEDDILDQLNKSSALKKLVNKYEDNSLKFSNGNSASIGFSKMIVNNKY